MSDWTSGWTAMREGLTSAAQLREQKAAREKADAFNKTRQEQENTRLGFERQRSDREADIYNRRLTRKPFVPQEGQRVAGATYDADGNPTITTERIPDAFDAGKQTTKLADGTTAVVDSNGKPIHFIPPNTSTEVIQAFGLGGPGVTPPGSPQQAPSASPLVDAAESRFPLPRTVQPPGQEAQPTAAAPTRRPQLQGFSGGHPTIGFTYDVPPPTVVERPIPGGAPQKFIQSFDPSTGRETLSPYNLPESANKISDRKVTEANFAAAKRYVGELREAVKQSGTWSANLPFGLSNDKSSATFSQTPYLLAIAMAKILDPGSVAREGEVAAAKKYMVPLGMFNSEGRANAALNKLEAELDQKAKEFGLGPSEPAGAPAAPVAFSTPEEAHAAEAAGARFSTNQPVRIGGRLFKWEPPAK